MSFSVDKLGLLYGVAENLNVKTDTTLKLAELKGEG